MTAQRTIIPKRLIAQAVKKYSNERLIVIFNDSGTLSSAVTHIGIKNAL